MAQQNKNNLSLQRLQSVKTNKFFLVLLGRLLTFTTTIDFYFLILNLLSPSLFLKVTLKTQM